ncbi:MAG: hypothetical protein IE880_01750 [Epsilonproteobacteria bacterium]|nr:hypothetical protein [Campylobacterota bacterium]
MKLNEADNKLLKELCEQYKLSYEKIHKLLEVIKENEFKERRVGVYESLKEIIMSDIGAKK